ncbi:MAG TPA: response regulator transcription factor [Mycobacteriales bacterium]|nr:response regulator transcription factor [Mycobacteriales bacterium]
MTGRLVLVVDDEVHIRNALRTRLTSAGYRVADTGTGTDAVALAATGDVAVVILDMGLPDLDGPEVVRRIRAFSRVPIVVLSVLDSDRDKISALDEGADDYVTKPFSLDELLARVRAAIRRAEAPPPGAPARLRVGRLTVDLGLRAVTVDGEPVRLTATQWALLEQFVANPGKLLTRSWLIAHVWGSTHGSEASALRLYVSHLRRLIETEPADPRHLLTEVGAGYRLVGVEAF